LKQDLTAEKQRFLTAEKSFHGFQHKMKIKNKKVQKEIKSINEESEKKDQELHMMEMRIRELERFIHFNSRPKHEDTSVDDDKSRKLDVVII